MIIGDGNRICDSLSNTYSPVIFDSKNYSEIILVPGMLQITLG